MTNHDRTNQPPNHPPNYPPRATEGKTCRALCSDGADQAVKDYVSVCQHDARGAPYYEDFDLTWKATGKPMSTSRVQ